MHWVRYAEIIRPYWNVVNQEIRHSMHFYREGNEDSLDASQSKKKQSERTSVA